MNSKSLERLFGVLKGGRKGQAVMEYLITYGLALFVILIVLAILVAVVLPTLKAPESCQFTQPGFGCSSKQHVLVADGNNNLRAIVQLDNQQGRDVVLINVLCTDASTGNIIKSYVTEHGSLGSRMTIPAGGSVALPANCLNQEGGNVVMSPNSNFRGSLAIVYRFVDDVDVAGVPDRLAVATLTGTVQSE